jgi:hypothetical protein
MNKTGISVGSSIKNLKVPIGSVPAKPKLTEQE